MGTTTVAHPGDDGTTYRDRGRLLVGIGAILLTIGAAALYIGPLEVSAFYLFVEGGRFHYPGFAFGSFMFGNITAQVLGYYLIAALCIPLGYGHLKLRRWARTCSLTLLWTWLVVGLPLVPILLFMLLSAKAPSVAGAVVFAVLLASSYFLVPGLLIAFYRSISVRDTFERQDPRSYWTEQIPLPVLTLCAVFVCYLLVLHMLLLFNGIFPVYGRWFSGRQGITLIDILIVCLLSLTWGTFRRRTWAWWGSLAYIGLLTVSSVWTFCTSTWQDVLSVLDLPSFEMERLGGMPLHGAHLAAAIGIPLLVTLALILHSRRHWMPGRSGWLPIL